MDETSHAIGALKAEVDVLKDEVKSLREDVRTLLAALEAGKSSIRMLMTVGAIATTLGAGVATVVSWFR